MIEVYNAKTIAAKMCDLENWKFTNNHLEKQFVFKTFPDAISFVVKISFLCEKLNHHPEWTNSYNKLFIKLYTHDKNGVTDKDIELATQINAYFSNT